MAQQFNDYALKDFVQANEATGEFQVRKCTSEEGRTFFAIAFKQPNKEFTDKNGQKRPAYFNVAFSKSVTEKYGIDQKTPEEIKELVMAHASEWRAAYGTKADGSRCTLPSMFLPGEVVGGTLF